MLNFKIDKFWKQINLTEIISFKSLKTKSLFFSFLSFVLFLFVFPQDNHRVLERCKSIWTIMTCNFIYIISIYKHPMCNYPFPFSLNLPTQTTLNLKFTYVYDNKRSSQTSSRRYKLWIDQPVERLHNWL